ncbi:MAG: hypothetical protein JXR78_07660 [Victivallales bacterium]|nr:hypothetical protein [Victivallales bacterium]
MSVKESFIDSWLCLAETAQVFTSAELDRLRQAVSLAVSSGDLLNMISLISKQRAIAALSMTQATFDQLITKEGIKRIKFADSKQGGVYLRLQDLNNLINKYARATDGESTKEI